MPTQIGILTSAGLQSVTYTADNLTDAAQYEPDGIYTVTRTYNRTYALKLADHFERMEESARLEGIPLMLNREAIRSALRTLIDASGFTESRFRITIPASHPNQAIITIEPFAGVPADLKEKGVAVSTVRVSRQNPQSKDTAWMAQREAAKANAKPAYEYIILNEQDQLLEGFGSNFYAIKDDQLWTAPVELVLGGISRQITLDVAPQLLPVQLHPITLADTPILQGAFLTSSSRSVIPIVAIDDHPISDGPSNTIRALSQAYDAWVNAHLLPI